MAEMLKRQNDIVTLKVELKAQGRVVCTLQYLEYGELVSLHLWTGEQEAFGLQAAFPTEAPRKKNLKFPVELTTSLLRLWQQHADQQECLWVHLVQPSGTLNFLPWERLLDICSTPTLMLPDFIFPPPQKSLEQLDVVVCASAPLQSEKADTGIDLLDTLRAIAVGVDRPVRLHVFTDSDLSAQLIGQYIGCDVITYDPLAAPFPATEPLGRSLSSPWLIWMRDALSRYSVDAVHFICHGHLSGRAGSLLFAQSPTGRSDDYLSSSVEVTELCNFLTQVGAWATAFSTPTDNHSNLGLRVLADQIAQTLPGPMMMYDASRASCLALEDGYRFVHSASGHSPAYHHGSLYLYCQPYLLASAVATPGSTQGRQDVRELVVRYARNVAQAETVLGTYAQGGDAAPGSLTTSPAAAATERAAEQIQLRYQKLIRDEVVPGEVALHDLSIAMETIQQFRKALDEVEQLRVSPANADKGDKS